MIKEFRVVATDITNYVNASSFDTEAPEGTRFYEIHAIDVNESPFWLFVRYVRWGFSLGNCIKYPDGAKYPETQPNDFAEFENETSHDGGRYFDHESIERAFSEPSNWVGEIFYVETESDHDHSPTLGEVLESFRVDPHYPKVTGN